MKTSLMTYTTAYHEVIAEIDTMSMETDCYSLEKMTLDFKQAKEILALLPC